MEKKSHLKTIHRLGVQVLKSGCDMSIATPTASSFTNMLRYWHIGLCFDILFYQTREGGGEVEGRWREGREEVKGRVKGRMEGRWREG